MNKFFIYSLVFCSFANLNGSSGIQMIPFEELRKEVCEDSDNRGTYNWGTHLPGFLAIVSREDLFDSQSEFDCEGSIISGKVIIQPILTEEEGLRYSVRLKLDYLLPAEVWALDANGDLADNRPIVDDGMVKATMQSNFITDADMDQNGNLDYNLDLTRSFVDIEDFLFAHFNAKGFGFGTGEGEYDEGQRVEIKIDQVGFDLFKSMGSNIGYDGDTFALEKVNLRISNKE